MIGGRIKSLLRATITLQAIITVVFALLILPALALPQLNALVVN